jgi:opacity protein-like surface antigen
MRRLAQVAGLILFFAAAAHAQNVPEWEIFGGGDYLNSTVGSVPLGNGTSVALSQNNYGWHFTLGENKLSWLGGIVDFSGDYSNRTENFGTATAPVNVRFNGSTYPFLFGPRFADRHLGRFVPFGEAMIGGVHSRSTIASSATPTSSTKWAYAFGGGADFEATDLISIRGQFDWIRSHFPETLTLDSQNNYRASLGIVFTFGGSR